MTLTPLDAASASMAAPPPGVFGSTMRTLAPSVMSASACVFIVSSEPWALSILNWPEDRPAAWNALVRYGWSYATYRVDDVGAGSSTPIRPLPDDASDVS